MAIIWNNGNDGQPIVHNTLISGTSGNDTIHNDGDNVTIKGLAGDDELGDWGDFAIIDGGKGNDSIDVNDRENSTVYGGAGDDTIRHGTLIYGGRRWQRFYIG